MNILVPDSWLREYLETRAAPEQIGEYLSLCSQSVEKIEKIGDDFIYDIEITSNRPDCLSIYGIARELAAILPRFGISAKLENSFEGRGPSKLKDNLPLTVKITNSSLCPRFTAIILDKIKIGASPKLVQERLIKVGSRPLNNVVDISNYLMFALGQPIHTFDYDKIKKAFMFLRESKENEKITTLDGQVRSLPVGTIVIEDGEKRIVDLCGIMGGENSAVDNNTKRVLLFVQTYDPVRIRNTCQTMGFRTDAASRFEKGVEPEGVIKTLNQAIKMFEKNCQAEVASKLFDIYPHPPKTKTIKLDLYLVKKIIGIEIDKKEIIDILESLGFSIILHSPSIIQCTVPHWRSGDISIPEDLIEEVARIYGYHKLPSNLPNLPNAIRHSGERSDSRIKDGFWTSQNDKSNRFFFEEKIKTALKYWGLTEVVSYSMVSRDLLAKTQFNPQDYLKIANPLSDEWAYLRQNIIPSHLNILSQNTEYRDSLAIFEIANIYLPQGEKSLPDEVKMLTSTTLAWDFYRLKGILETLFSDLGIFDYKFKPLSQPTNLFANGRSAEIFINKKSIGLIGEINKKIALAFGLKEPLCSFDLELIPLIEAITTIKQFKPLPNFPATTEDLTFTFPQKTLVGEALTVIKKTDPLIVEVNYIGAFENNLTFKTSYRSVAKTLTGEEVAKIREKIIKVVKQKFRATLSG